MNSYPKWRNFQLTPNNHYRFFLVHTLPMTITVKFHHTLYINLLLKIMICNKKIRVQFLLRKLTQWCQKWCHQNCLKKVVLHCQYKTTFPCFSQSDIKWSEVTSLFREGKLIWPSQSSMRPSITYIQLTFNIHSEYILSCSKKEQNNNIMNNEERWNEVKLVWLMLVEAYSDSYLCGIRSRFNQQIES